MMRLIPSRAAVFAALAAAIAALLVWVRRDAQRDLTSDLERDDLTHANDIENRVSDARADPDGLRPFKDAGYRD